MTLAKALRLDNTLTSFRLAKATLVLGWRTRGWGDIVATAAHLFCWIVGTFRSSVLHAGRGVNNQ